MVLEWRQKLAGNITDNQRVLRAMMALFMAFSLLQAFRSPSGGGSSNPFNPTGLLGGVALGTNAKESEMRHSQVDAVTATPTPVPESGDKTSQGEAQPGYALPDQESLRLYMAGLINAARANVDSTVVSLDDTISIVAQAHAEEMAEYDYLSHWNFQGFGPDIRYNLAGGTDKSQENVYGTLHTFNGNPVEIEDWQHELDKAFAYLMSSSLHRANILAPEHTHVGIGLAYNQDSGEFRVVQIFTNRYIALDDAQHMAEPGDVLNIRGRLLQDVEEVLINLDYERFPDDMSLEELRQTAPYRTRAGNIDYIYVTVNSDNSFRVNVPVSDEEGLYHVRIWLTIDGVKILATDLIVWATEP